MRDYEVLEKIGQGSFGVVFRVRRRVDSKIFALKQLKFRGMSAAEQAASEREVKILARLRHPFVLAHVDSFVEEDSLNVVVEFCERGDLAQAIERQRGKGFMEENVVWRYFIQLCLGLQCACDCELRKIASNETHV